MCEWKYVFWELTEWVSLTLLVVSWVENRCFSNKDHHHDYFRNCFQILVLQVFYNILLVADKINVEFQITKAGSEPVCCFYKSWNSVDKRIPTRDTNLDWGVVTRRQKAPVLWGLLTCVGDCVRTSRSWLRRSTRVKDSYWRGNQRAEPASTLIWTTSSTNSVYLRLQIRNQTRKLIIIMVLEVSLVELDEHAVKCSRDWLLRVLQLSTLIWAVTMTQVRLWQHWHLNLMFLISWITEGSRLKKYPKMGTFVGYVSH